MFDLWFDRSIGRMVEYAAMLRRFTLAGLLCLPVLIGVSCAAKPLAATRLVAMKPASAPRVASVPQPAFDLVPYRAFEASAPVMAQAPAVASQPAGQAPSDASPQSGGEGQASKGDPLVESPSERAPIDDLLAISPDDQPQPTAATAVAVAEDLELTTHDIDIPLNEKVLSFVELFNGRLKGYLEDGLSRGNQYLPMIQSVFKAEGIPLDLAYVPLV